MENIVRTISVTTLLIMVIGSLFSQEVISTSGNTFKNDKKNISWTIGETVIETIGNRNLLFTQGFHQSKSIVTNVPEIVLTDIITYPNPTKQFVNVSIRNTKHNSLKYTLCNLAGKLIEKGDIINDSEQIDMQQLISGVYLLKVYNQSGVSQTFKIIKLE
jgi:hypothetical protein